MSIAMVFYSQSSEQHFLEENYEHILVQNEKIHAHMREEEEEIVRKCYGRFLCTQTVPPDSQAMNIVDMLQGNL